MLWPDSHVARCVAVVRPALLLAPTDFLGDIRDRLERNGVQAAVAAHDTGPLFDWIVGLLDRQGISNAAAVSFAERQGSARWSDVDASLADQPLCPKLKSYWHFVDCGYRKGAQSCGRPDLLQWCPVPRLPARKGALNQAAFGLALFLRDVCEGDLVAWIDSRLGSVNVSGHARDQAARRRAALLDPLVNIPGTGRKVWSMILAELLLAGDPARASWVATGASMIAVDSLVHAYLHRTGILRRLNAEHAYGPACYLDHGCTGVIEALAAGIDAREFGQEYPAYFPRFVQFAIWWFCSEGGWSICNGNNIDDRHRCDQRFCPAFHPCDKIELKPYS